MGPHQQSGRTYGEFFHFLFPKSICMTSVSGDSVCPGYLVLTQPASILGWGALSIAHLQ